MSPLDFFEIEILPKLGRRVAQKPSKVGWTYSPFGYCISRPLGIDKCGYAQ